ncbi:hypothetical protein, conserved [Eimeria praecox]|uniref:Hexosyltransferase n=1 Tax=Eimeria praecox TaxID=51316 RepID=U6G057_9EIME|nr:hypothetical protein, conserved [Eimeria praecox]
MARVGYHMLPPLKRSSEAMGDVHDLEGNPPRSKSPMLLYIVISKACSWKWHGEPQVSMLSLPLQTNWRLLITPKVSCAEDPPFAALMVMTGAGDSEGRMVVRNTWGEASRVANRRIRLFFLLGTVKQQEVQKAVEKEAEAYGDILQHAAPDKYTNLSTKAATMIQWMAESCPQAKFLVKADTDTLVNLDLMIPYLIKVENKGDLALGSRLDNMPIITSEKSRNYQDPLVFPRKTFPPYLSGACYIVSGSLIQKVARVLPEVPRVRNEDTFLGMCLERLRIEPTDIGPEARINPWFDPAKGPCAAFRLAAAHAFKRDLLVAIWKWWKTEGAKMCH